MLPADLPPTYFNQNTSAEIREYTSPLEVEEIHHEPEKPPYHLTEVQLTPIVGTARYNGLAWLFTDNYMSRPIPNLTYLYASGSVSPLL
jgi:hypothetical protein